MNNSGEELPIVLGKFVYITLPPKEESKILVDENTKDELSKKMLITMSRLQIWAIGDSANTKLKVGQWVLIKPEALQRADIVPFEHNGEKVTKALILDYDIVHIWK